MGEVDDRIVRQVDDLVPRTVAQLLRSESEVDSRDEEIHAPGIVQTCVRKERSSMVLGLPRARRGHWYVFGHPTSMQTEAKEKHWSAEAEA